MCLASQIVNTGLKVFTKVTEKGETFYRPSEEALGFADRFFTRRLLSLPPSDLEQLLGTSQHVPFASLTGSGAKETLEALPIGPAVVSLDTDRSFSINVWVGKGSLLPRVSKLMRSEVRDTLARKSGVIAK